MKTIPELKIKLTMDEQAQLLKLFAALIEQQRAISAIDYIDFWNLLSISHRIQNAQVRLYHINSYKRVKTNTYLFKVDLNEWRTLAYLYTISKDFLATHPYYDNLYRMIHIEFEKQAATYQVRVTANNFTNQLN
jgi:hypothetical protein